MIISRKNFDEAIKRAVRENNEKIWMDRRIDDMGREFDTRMCRIEQRLFELEHKEDSGKCCNDVVAKNPAPYNS